MRYRNRYNQRRRRSGGAFVWILLIVAFFFVASGAHLDSDFFLPLLFVGLAFIVLISSFFRLNPNRIYGGFYGFIWLMSLALCFVIGFWPWILLPIILSILLSVLRRPLLAVLLSLGVFSLLNRNQAAPPLYTPPVQPYQPPVQPYNPPYQPQQSQYPQQSQQTQYYQPYGEGYQTNGEQAQLNQDAANNPPYPSAQQYDQPQSHYVQQELPPQQ